MYLDAFLPVGFKLVGPYDVLAGHMNALDSKYLEKGVLHWRYYYDPPEFQVSVFNFLLFFMVGCIVSSVNKMFVKYSMYLKLILLHWTWKKLLLLFN